MRAGARGDSEPTQERAGVPATREHQLEDCFVRHHEELLGTLFHLVGNLDDARDALQDAFVKCWQRRDELAKVSCLRAWVFQVALNAGRDQRKSAWKRKKKPLDPERESTLVTTADDPASSSAQGEEVERLRQAVLELRPEEKEIFLLRENGELTYEQIGAALGIPVGTVKTRMRAALTRIRGMLGPKLA